jgi:hypothetical protein
VVEVSVRLWFVESISDHLVKLVAEDGVSWRVADKERLPEGVREGEWVRQREFPIEYDRDLDETERRRKEVQDLMDKVSAP